MRNHEIFQQTFPTTKFGLHKILTFHIKNYPFLKFNLSKKKPYILVAQVPPKPKLTKKQQRKLERERQEEARRLKEEEDLKKKAEEEERLRKKMEFL